MTEESSDQGADRPDSEDVAEEVPGELLEYLRESVGENLRAVAHYDRDAAVIEVNESVGDSISDDHIEEVIDDLRLQDVSRTRQESLYEVGSLYCSIRAFDDALVVHFLQGDARGTMISVEPSTAPGLTDFIYDVLGILHEHSGQEINRAPQWMG